VLLVESAYVVDEADAAHFGADGLEGAVADVVLVHDGFKGWQELVLGPFEFYEDGEEGALVGPVVWEENLCELIEPFHAGDPVMVEVYLGCWGHFVVLRSVFLS